MPAYAAPNIAAIVDNLNLATRSAVEFNDITDQIFDTCPGFGLMRSSKILKEQRGGLFIQRNFNIGKSPNAGWYSGAGAFKMAKFEGVISGGWDWKFAHDSVVVLGPELVINSGSEEAVYDLVQERVDVASLTLPDLMATDFYTNNPYGTRSDGTPGNPSSVEGLAVLVDDGTISNTVGGLSRTTYPSLKSPVNYNNALGATFINSLQTLNLATQRGATSRVRVHLTTSNAFGAYWSSLQSPERYVIDPTRLETMGIKNTGGNDLAFNDAPVILDPKIPTGVFRPGTTSGSGGFWYGLNTDFFEHIVHPERFFSLGEWQKDQYGDQYFMDIFYAGCMLNKRPNKSFASWVSGA